jgi:hypothetical protein
MEKTYFIETKEQYLAILSCWRNFLLSGGKPNASHMMLYNILRSKPWDRGFSPTTKKIKLANGHYEWFGLKLASLKISAASIYGGSYLKDLLEPFNEPAFGKIIGKEEIDRAWALIKEDPRLR